MLSIVFGIVALISLTAGEAGSSASPDGPLFLFTGPQELAVLGIESKTTLIKYTDGTFLLDPAASPDGKTLAFASQPPATQGASGEVDFGSDVVLTDSDGKNARTVLAHETIGEFPQSAVHRLRHHDRERQRPQR